ncbi:BrnT family toxin [Thiohalorhabdus sp.]|uniref:BrnT family toxin n=1 Tax=Thiohalorhabdus sp. TaxID=3094134 RepID=UPI003FCC78E9
MEFEWDPEKAARNREKHGVSFEDAVGVFSGPTLTERSDRKGEKRWIAVGRLEGRLVTVVYTRRSGTTRIISARRASQNEREQYRQNVA